MRRFPFLLAWLGASLAGTAPPVQAQDGRALTELVGETQRQTSQTGRIGIVWWMPDEFWRLSALSNPEVPPESADSLVRVVHRFTIIGAMSAKMGKFANLA